MKNAESKRLLGGLVITLLMLTPLNAAPPAATPRPGPALPPGLVGTWTSFADDETPDRKPPAETLVLKADGTFKVTGTDSSYEGRFWVDGDKFVMTIVAEGTTRVLRRGFKLDKDGFHFANNNQGFAHYKKAP